MLLSKLPLSFITSKKNKNQLIVMLWGENYSKFFFLNFLLLFDLHLVFPNIHKFLF